MLNRKIFQDWKIKILSYSKIKGNNLKQETLILLLIVELPIEAL